MHENKKSAALPSARTEPAADGTEKPGAGFSADVAETAAPDRRGRLEKLFEAEEEAATSDSRMAKILAVISSRFKPGQIFTMPWPRALPYLFTGHLCLLIQILSMNMLQNNMPQLEAHFQASLIESMWLISAYMAPYASFTVLLIKIRTQIGMRRFTFIALSCFIACTYLDTQFSNYNSALFMRFLSGLTTAPISSIGILYMIEPFVPTRKVTIGISLSMMCIALGMPLARLVAPYLVADNGVSSFYYFEMGLACLAVFFVFFLHLSPLPQAKVLEKLDFISFPLFALGLGLNAAMLPVGKYYWWSEASWMGYVYAAAIFCLTCSLLIELNRKIPLIDFRWLFSVDMLHITLVMLTFRLLVSDQSSLISSYFSFFNLQNDQLATLYLFVALGIVAGAVLCCLVLQPGGGDYLYLLGSAAIAIGSFSDSLSTNATRPADMYLSQMLIGFGTALFMAVSFSKGLLAAIVKGQPQYITSFTAAFLFTQSTGGLTGSAFFGTLQIYFEKFHSYILTQYLVMSDSQVAARVAAYGRVYGNVLTDSAQAQAQGLNILAQKTSIEANILAYNDVFRIYGVIAVALFCLLIIRIFLKAYFARLLAQRTAAAHNGAEALAA